MSDSSSKQYTNGEVTVVWKPGTCIHSGICVGLPEVFNPKARPWINMEGAGTDRIIEQVKKCPSGALSYFMNDGSDQETISSEAVKAEVIKNGPLMVHCDIKVVHADGREEERTKRTAFCRCGASSNKPYCDGSHKSANFQG